MLGPFLETLIGGLLTGVLYSLVALGFVLIFKASGVFNFAQGAMVLFAALTIGRFGFDIELLYLVRRWKLRLHRMPIAMVHRPGSTVRVLPDSLRMLRDIAHIRRHAGRYPGRPEGLGGTR